ncbi:MAG: competence/damage-inducible protein A [Flavobacteriales bacterium]|nr:competence/damage-inducible protein A [Flavobacteriales bacterium]
MFAEIITIGDEILIGQTVDTNSAWMAQNLNRMGVELIQSRSVSDKEASIIKALDSVDTQSQLILITGGLGPTRDDITKRVLSEYFGASLVRNQEVLEKIEDYFSQRGRQILESNRRQADLPDKATILPNPLGTASGMWFEKGDKIYVSMPGVPYEMKGLMTNEVLPRIKERFDLPKIYYRTLMTEGIGESFLAEIIQDWESSLTDKGISIAYLPSPGVVKIRLGAKGNDEAEIKEKVDFEIQQLYKLIPSYIFGENDISMPEAISPKLKKSGKTISTAESCTGGYLAHLITTIPGSSDYFKGSVIAYSNEVKMAQLEVKKADLDANGAVSEAVIRQMAEGARKHLQTDLALATSGVAGPDGGSDEKPVGTVWIALAAKEGVYAKKYTFEKNRSRNIRRASLAALSLVRRYLDGQLELT